MANSYLEYTGNGSLTTFTSPPYLEASHLVVSVDGTIKTITTDYTVSGTTVTFTTAPAGSSKIRISRNSSQSTRLNDYSDASLLTADTMDADANQLFYMAQEAIDTASETNVASNTFYTSGTTEPTSPNVGDLFFNTTTGLLRVYSGSDWINANGTATRYTITTTQASQTIFILTNSVHGRVTSTSQVFYNGILLKEGSGVNGDYTISFTGGVTSTVTLNSGVPAGSIIEIFNF